MLASRFTGILKNWWEKHLTDESRYSIIHAIQEDEDGNPLFDEHVRMRPPDGVNCLIFNIIRHFIRTPSNIT